MKYTLHLIGALALAGGVSMSQLANADLLDDVIADGELKCGVMLDVPPVGMRDDRSRPISFDVEFCQDMAQARQHCGDTSTRPHSSHSFGSC